jgi:tRNA uridine 5-carbamoylmethylation protein Kti12
MREPAVVLLYGYPAAGKFTIAQALAARMESEGATVRVIDNHYVNNVIFGVLDVDGIKPITRDVWRKVLEVRNAVFDTIRDLSPPHFSFVVTNYLAQNHDEPLVDELRALAELRQSRFVVARLECDVDELCRRAPSPERSARMKWRDVEALRALCAATELIAPVPGELVFDTTATPPQDVAAAIAAQLAS